MRYIAQWRPARDLFSVRAFSRTSQCLKASNEGNKLSSETKECKQDVEGFPEPNRIEPSWKQPKVVIVGAGMAGLAAAHRLTKCGITDIVVLEALTRAGGRVHSMRLGEGAIELGAQWIEGTDNLNPVYHLANQQGLLKPPIVHLNESRGIFMTSEGEVVVGSLAKSALHIFQKLLRKARSILWEGGDRDVSLGEYLRQGIAESLKKFRPCEAELASRVMLSLMNDVQSKWGSHPDNISAFFYGSSRPVHGRTHVPGGFQGITGALMRGLKENQVRYNKPACCVVWSPVVRNSPRVVTTCADGEEIPSDFVVVTAPLGFLKNNPYFFRPELPEQKREAIDRIGFGLVNKVFLEFAKPFWVKNEGYFKPAWSVEELKHRTDWTKSIGSIEEVPGCRNVLVCEVGGPEAIRIEELAEAELVQEMTHLIRHILNDLTLPFPKTMLRSNWCTNPYFGGSVSYLGLGSDPEMQRRLTEPCPYPDSGVAPVLLFAGEATYPGKHATVQGAVLSGIREADRIVEITKQFQGPPRAEGQFCFMERSF